MALYRSRMKIEMAFVTGRPTCASRAPCTPRTSPTSAAPCSCWHSFTGSSVSVACAGTSPASALGLPAGVPRASSRPHSISLSLTTRSRWLPGRISWLGFTTNSNSSNPAQGPMLFVIAATGPGTYKLGNCKAKLPIAIPYHCDRMAINTNSTCRYGLPSMCKQRNVICATAVPASLQLCICHSSRA